MGKQSPERWAQMPQYLLQILNVAKHLLLFVHMNAQHWSTDRVVVLHMQSWRVIQTRPILFRCNSATSDQFVPQIQPPWMTRKHSEDTKFQTKNLHAGIWWISVTSDLSSFIPKQPTKSSVGSQDEFTFSLLVYQQTRDSSNWVNHTGDIPYVQIEHFWQTQIFMKQYSYLDWGEPQLCLTPTTQQLHEHILCTQTEPSNVEIVVFNWVLIADMNEIWVIIFCLLWRYFQLVIFGLGAKFSKLSLKLGRLCSHN